MYIYQLQNTNLFDYISCIKEIFESLGRLTETLKRLTLTKKNLD